MVCMELRSISPPFDDGETVELRFTLPACGEVLGGELAMRVAVCDGPLYMVGDRYTIRMRRS